MDQLMADRHPEPDEVQRCADGDVDPVRDAELVAHVEACATCRAELERMRRVAARLCLSSPPPAGLFERIKARRDAGERVLLPSVGPVEQRPGPGTGRSTAAAGPAIARPPWRGRRAWRWALAPLAAAAAVLLVARLVLVERRSGDQGGLRGAGVEDSAAARDSAMADSARSARADSAALTPGAEAGSLVWLRENRAGLVIRLAAATTSLDPGQAQALDSAARALKQDPERRAIIRYVDPSFNHESESWRLALRAADRLALGGVESERVRLVRVQAVSKVELPPALDAIEVVITLPAAADR